MSGTARAHYIAAHVLLAAVVAQFFLAGLDVFGAASIAPHETVGHVIEVLALLILILALIAKRARAWSAALLVAVILQTALPNLDVVSPFIGALHPLNAVVILFISAAVFRGAAPSLRAVERSSERPAAAQAG